MRDKVSLRSDLPNGVVIIAHHFPGYGSRPCWELRVIYLTANRYLEKISTMADDDISAVLAVKERIAKYKPMSNEDLWQVALGLSGCEYEGCERYNDECPPAHDKVTDPVCQLCSFCDKPIIGWQRSWADRRQCWACYKASSEYSPHSDGDKWRYIE